MGFAVQEGLISLDEKLTDAFADDIPENPDENLKKATVRDLFDDVSWTGIWSFDGRTEAAL